MTPPDGVDAGPHDTAKARIVNVNHDGAGDGDGDVKVNAPHQRQRRGPRQFQPISGRTAWSDSDQQSSPGATSKSRPMNITHFNDSAIDSCSGYGKPLTPENEYLAVKLALVQP
ncbi:MAG: hypothetical protein ACI9WU_001798 [Myxococcota bacterium]